MSAELTPLPIDSTLPSLIESFGQHPSLVLEAPAGAGKTTRVPRAMLEAGFANNGEIIVLEPRRIAARLAAKRVADELNEPLGQRVGYQVRFDEIASRQTQIRFVTEGILTRKLLNNPNLNGVSAVLLDEFHERHLQGDISLALLKQLQQSQRPDLRIAVMSATLDGAKVSEYLNCPVIRSEGKRFNVDIRHSADQDERPIEKQVISALKTLVREGLRGHVLVFLPGAAEIRKTLEALGPLAAEYQLLLLPLHGDLPANEQDRALQQTAQNKVILSTNVAESSVTIDGIYAIIDSGLARVATFSPWTGMGSLTTQKISKASATQRAGRAGRTREGICIRLYTEREYNQMTDHDSPEITRSDLSDCTLELLSQKLDPGTLDWFTPPPKPALDAAHSLLDWLGAIDSEKNITPIGQQLLKTPIHPRLGRIILEGQKRGCEQTACLIAALLGERDIVYANRSHFSNESNKNNTTSSQSDILDRVELFENLRDANFRDSVLRDYRADTGAVRAVDRAFKQLTRLYRNEDKTHDTESVLRSVLAGFADRVARRRDVNKRDFVFSNGSAQLAETSAVHHAPFIVAVDADTKSKRPGDRIQHTVIRLASAIEPEWLLEDYESRIRESIDVEFDANAERVTAKQRLWFGELMIDESKSSKGAEHQIAQALAKAALDKGLGAFTDSPDELERWLYRGQFVHSLDPKFPAFDSATLNETLVALCEGKSSFRELRDENLRFALEASLTGPQLLQMQRWAPERVELRNGRKPKVEYAPNKAPWIESYLQDFFGMADGPSIGDGRVKLVLHLQAPNKRAVQITTDLAGFWATHYPSIRKELCRRYPRHKWPETPNTGQ